MGVKDLWKLLEPAGRPVDLEQLRGVVLGIDVSVWLHQAVHGARDRSGQPLQSAHLALLFSRICKLLHFQIRPVFVFDGGTPALKQRTLAARSKRRQSASKKGQKAEEKQRSKYMQARILQQMTGENSTVPRPQTQPDMFDLPPLPDDLFSRERSPTIESTGESLFVEDVERVDLNSSEFASLPPELQHEILQERQEMERHTFTDPGALPPAASDFSNYQLSRLLHRSKLTRQLEEVRNTLKAGDTAREVVGGRSGSSCEVESNQIMSSDSAHYILVKGVDLEGSSTQDKLNDVIISGDDVIDNSGENSVHLETEEKKSDVIFTENDIIAEAEEEEGVEEGKIGSATDGGVSAGEVGISSESSAASSEEEPSLRATPVAHDKQEGERREEREKTPSVADAGELTAEPSASQAPFSEPALFPSSPPIKGAPVPSVSSPGSAKYAGSLTKSNSPTSPNTEPGDSVSGAVVDGETEEMVGSVGEGEDLLRLSHGEAQRRLREEVAELGRESERQRRAAASLNSQVYREAQELLSLFGLPYVISPMEAEAQCAHLDHTHQTHGSITDDSDIFLFGGRGVYRHFFSQDHQPSFFSAEDIQSILGLSQQRLVCLAFLLGSDYTPGLDGVGVVNAMEVIGQFRGDGLDILEKLKAWHSEVNSAPGLSLKSSLERKLCSFDLPDDFPSQAVWQAYMTPEVDNSTEQFQWGTPDLDLIRKFMLGHVGWSQDRVDSILLPVLKKTNNREMRITSYFTPSLPTSSPSISSKRLRNVVARITTGDNSPETSPKPKRSKVNNTSGGSQCGVSKRGRGRGRGRRPQPNQTTSSTKLSASSSSSSDEG